MFSVNQKVLKLLADKYHVELENCDSLGDIINLLEKTAQKEGLKIKHASSERVRTGLLKL
jgi:transcriptional regulator